MKMKFGLTALFLQLLTVIFSGFIMLTQLNSIRQPTKLLIQCIGVLSLLSFIIVLINYFKEEKD